MQKSSESASRSAASAAESAFFASACETLKRETAPILIQSSDLTPTPEGNTFAEKLGFVGKMLYLGVFKGFAPFSFKLSPTFWYWFITNALGNMFWRRLVLSRLLRLQGYGKVCNWKSDLYEKDAPSSLAFERSSPGVPCNLSSFSAQGRLAKLRWSTIDPAFSDMCEALTKRGALNTPHSQAPSIIEVLTQKGTFSGNFFDHLVGVWKGLVAWGQSAEVARAGFFHSVYGTNQFRAGIYEFTEREELRSLIGAPAESLAFLICTAERMKILQELIVKLHGASHPLLVRAGFQAYYDASKKNEPRPMERLTDKGFSVTNHVTGEEHVMPPRTFAAFCVVMIADFMEQGVSGPGVYETDDITFFQFMNTRLFADVIRFVRPYLDNVPAVWEKYGLLSDERYEEPSREEILGLKSAWDNYVAKSPAAAAAMPEKERAMLVSMVEKYPWIPEPMVALAVAGGTRKYAPRELAMRGKALLEEWGMTFYKQAGHVKDVYALCEAVEGSQLGGLRASL